MQPTSPTEPGTPERDETYSKSSSHDGKKLMSEQEAAEVVANKPWYRYYKCDFCPSYHLTKDMNPRLWYKKHQQEVIDKAVAADRAAYRQSLRERLTAAANTYSNDGDFSDDAPALIEAVPLSEVQQLLAAEDEGK